MTSSCELRFDAIPIIDQKAFVPDELIYLFQESDRKTARGADDEYEVGYFAPRAIVLHRLDFAGYTSERSRQAFEEWLQEQHETFDGYVEAGGDWALSRNTLLTCYDFSQPRDDLPHEKNITIQTIGCFSRTIYCIPSGAFLRRFQRLRRFHLILARSLAVDG